MADANEGISNPKLEPVRAEEADTEGIAEPRTEPRTTPSISWIMDATVLVVLVAKSGLTVLLTVVGAAMEPSGYNFVPNELGEEAEHAKPRRVGQPQRLHCHQ